MESRRNIADENGDACFYSRQQAANYRCMLLFVNVIAKLPLLETLEVSQAWFKLNLKDVSHACPHLKTLKLNCSGYIPCDDDDYAFAIAESMTELRHLQLFGNRLTDVGLNAILDNIPHLEHLDLRKCFNINLVGNLEKRCLEIIKELRRPHDSTDDYPFDIIFHHSDDDDLDYIYGGDDIDEFEYDDHKLRLFVEKRGKSHIYPTLEVYEEKWKEFFVTREDAFFGSSQ